MAMKLSPDDISSLLDSVDEEMEHARGELEHAQSIIQTTGLTVHSSVLNDFAHVAGSSGAGAGGDTTTGGETKTNNTMDLQQEAALAVQARHKYNPMRGTLSAFPLVLTTTGGHCNTDHVIHQNPDGTVNKLSEYKRMMKRRYRHIQLEERGADRWDLPRIPGGRRRRIKRYADAPSAPPEPPSAGYVIYVSQMTTKLRHDNPDRHHNQISAVRRISNMWNNLSEKEREHYINLARDARSEYEHQLLQYRSTGQWSPSTKFTRLRNKNGQVQRDERSTGSNGPWVRIPYEEKNELERELDAYEQVIFPPRPKAMEREHEEKAQESREKRKEKMMMENRGSVKRRRRAKSKSADTIEV